MEPLAINGVVVSAFFSSGSSSCTVSTLPRNLLSCKVQVRPPGWLRPLHCFSVGPLVSLYLPGFLAGATFRERLRRYGFVFLYWGEGELGGGGEGGYNTEGGGGNRNGIRFLCGTFRVAAVKSRERGRKPRQDYVLFWEKETEQQFLFPCPFCGLRALAAQGVCVKTLPSRGCFRITAPCTLG